jgi:hypothetical protein
VVLLDDGGQLLPDGQIVSPATARPGEHVVADVSFIAEPV